MKYYAIGKLRARVDPGPIDIQDDMLTAAFVSGEEEAEDSGESFSVSCCEGDLSFLQEWETELYTGAYEIRRKEGKRYLVNHWMTDRFAFALDLDGIYGREQLQLLCNKEMRKPISLTAAHFLGMVGLHHRLLQVGCAVVHASYITHNGKGILFAAPSQTGKSTQAELWRQYAGAEILNGDRALIFCRDGIWYAGGYIACGSSETCKNESYPLGGIVFLEQGKDNLIRPATAKERVCRLFAGMEKFHWSVEDTDLALALASRVGAEVPVLHYSCRPDEAAVYTLKRYLEEMSSC